MKAGIEKYAVAVRDDGGLLLFLWVKCSEGGDFYGFLPRPHDTSINAHASYHADGQFHVKSHDMAARNKIMAQTRQKPDQSFVGAENLLDQTIRQRTSRDIGRLCDPREWSDVFEFHVSAIRSGAHYTRVSIDLVSPGCSPNFVPNVRIVSQRKFRTVVPFVVATLYEMPHGG